MPKEILDQHLAKEKELIKVPLSKEVLLRQYLRTLISKNIVLNVLVY